MKNSRKRQFKNTQFAKLDGLKETIRYPGFVAQEVKKAEIIAGFDFSGIDKPKNKNDLYSLRYADFLVLLVKAVHEQQEIIQSQQQQISRLEQEINQ